MASSQEILERGRGRRAATPSEISAPGWKDILLRVWKNIGEDRVMLVAAGVTFYCLLAIFPAIAALVAIYGFFSDPASISSHVDKLSGVMPGGALDVIRNQMNQVASQGPSKLGVAFIISFLVSSWSANAGIKSIFDALNLVYDEPEKRGLIRLKPFIVGFYRSRNPFHPGCDCLHCRAPSSRFEPIARCNCCHRADRALADSLYHYRRRSCFCLPLWPEPRRASTAMDHLGKRFAAIAWIAVSLGFSWYAANFGSYNKTYGSLAAVVVLMFWLWLSAAIILIGAELDAEMEHQTVRDTTVGRGKPMGARGARMADTVGAAQD
jgi:membrane protein